MHSNIMTTDLGEEKRCARCGEYWPADEEFFAVCKGNKSGPHRRQWAGYTVTLAGTGRAFTRRVGSANGADGMRS